MTQCCPTAKSTDARTYNSRKDPVNHTPEKKKSPRPYPGYLEPLKAVGHSAPHACSRVMNHEPVASTWRALSRSVQYTQSSLSNYSRQGRSGKKVLFPRFLTKMSDAGGTKTPKSNHDVCFLFSRQPPVYNQISTSADLSHSVPVLTILGTKLNTKSANCWSWMDTWCYSPVARAPASRPRPVASSTLASGSI